MTGLFESTTARRAGLHVVAATAALVVAGICAPMARAAGTPAHKSAQSAVHTIVIEAVAYRPAVISVKRGDAVVWVNKDPFPHTVTAPGAFDSATIAPGASWRYVARTSGRFDYRCVPHPTMKGTLNVE